MNNNSAIDELKNALGAEVSTDKKELYRVSFDALKLSFMPSALIRPSTANAVGTVLKLANEYDIPVTTRGAGSSLTGAATPLNGGWVLDLSRLNNIKIDTLNKFAFVEAGAITGDIQNRAEEFDLYYPPDPASRSFCTIGGNIACNAGGPHCIKYGITRDYVVALEGFLPTGEAVSWGLPLRKFASGYNIRDLWIGSEGTLGVITNAVLKLIEKPEVTRTFLADFPTEAAALKGAQALLNQNIMPCVMEFLDHLSVRGAQEQTKLSIKTTPGHPILLIELDGNSASVKEETAILLKWAESHANLFIEAKSLEEANQLWEIRRKCSSAMFQFGNAKLNEDIVVPLDKTVDLIEFVHKLSDEKSLKIPVFGHAGDGNFHVNIMYNSEDAVEVKKAEEALQMLMEHVVSLGGAITAEHGIGLTKSPFLRLQHSESEIDAMLAIKKALDPKGILNPGKIFTPFRTWEYKRVNVAMPWDRK